MYDRKRPPINGGWRSAIGLLLAGTVIIGKTYVDTVGTVQMILLDD